MTENFIHSITSIIDVSMVSEYRYLTPSAIQRIFLSAAESHFKHQKVDVPHFIADLGLSWVMLATTAEIRSAVRPGEILTTKTWWTWHKGIVYRLEFATYHANGTLAITGTTFFSIIDMKTRKIRKDADLPDYIQKAQGQEMLEASSRCEALTGKFHTLFECPIMSSWLDELGHVNNFHYGEFVYDTLTEEEQRQLNHLRRFEIYFTGELRKGDSIQMNRLDSTDKIEVTGTRKSDGHIAFIAKLTLDE